jgi:hypothetical protein
MIIDDDINMHLDLNIWGQLDFCDIARVFILDLNSQ